MGYTLFTPPKDGLVRFTIHMEGAITLVCLRRGKDEKMVADYFGFVFVDTKSPAVVPLLERWKVLSDVRHAILVTRL